MLGREVYAPPLSLRQMTPEKKSFVNVDELMPQVTVWKRQDEVHTNREEPNMATGSNPRMAKPTSEDWK